ncbi:MAG: type II toxin-antitoxin system death-on-curing family toxin [Candidatus Magnetobacterium sp. LHC-1]
MEICFIGLEEVIEIHKDQIERYGGAPGIRDIGLLQSAIAMPQAGYGELYLHEDIYEMAGAYLFHIVKNHPFIDGNKRTGVVAAIVFLLINNIDLNADEEELETMVRSVAEGKADKADASKFLRKNSLLQNTP